MSATATRTLIPAGTWKADPSHSTVGFAVKHMGIATVRGEFNEFDGTVEVSEDGVVRAYGTVETASVDTGEAQRDDHLRSADFFDAEHNPQLSFASTAVEAAGEDGYRIIGDLTINGITNQVELDAEVTGTDVDPWGNTRVGLEITGQLSRGDYDMKFNQALGSGNMLVGDKVKLALDVSAVRQA